MTVHPFDKVFVDLFGSADQASKPLSRSHTVAIGLPDGAAASAETTAFPPDVILPYGHIASPDDAFPSLTKATTAPPVATNNRGADQAAEERSLRRLDSALEGGDGD